MKNKKKNVELYRAKSVTGKFYCDFNKSSPLCTNDVATILYNITVKRFGEKRYEDAFTFMLCPLFYSLYNCA